MLAQWATRRSKVLNPWSHYPHLPIGCQCLPGLLESLSPMAVSQYVLSSAILHPCVLSTSSSTVEVQFHFSRTQLQRTQGCSRMCSWYQGCIQCRLERIEPLEIPEDAAGGRCTEALRVVFFQCSFTWHLYKLFYRYISVIKKINWATALEIFSTFYSLFISLMFVHVFLRRKRWAVTCAPHCHLN